MDVDNGHHQLGETLLYGGFADLSKQVEVGITLRTAPMDRVGTCSTRQAEAKLDDLLAE